METAAEDRKLRGGIAGLGFFGRIQMEAWRRMSGVEIVAACDLDPERGREAAPSAYTSFEEMLERERLDFVDIATRPEQHLDMVRSAAARGIPVICQKPMAPSWEQAVELTRVVERAGIPCMIHENWRWQPWYREARRRIETGDIGTPVTYHFRTRAQDGMGPAPYRRQPYFTQMPRLLIYETIVHHIDTSRYLIGDLASVYAQTRRLNPIIHGEDQALLMLTHTNGLAGLIDGHRFYDLAPDNPVLGDTTIEGDAGLLHVASNGDLYIDKRRVWTNTVAEGYRGASVRATQQHFVDCLRTGAPFESECGDYLRQTFGAVEAAYRSVERKGAVLLAEIV